MSLVRRREKAWVRADTVNAGDAVAGRKDSFYKLFAISGRAFARWHLSFK
jgi:hypothetical protein